jgi:hypothetical protein
MRQLRHPNFINTLKRPSKKYLDGIYYIKIGLYALFVTKKNKYILYKNKIKSKV